MPEIVQEIGAYAGLAAVVGLSVLATLYFSQARDVKRLREWAGRAPERTAEQAVTTQPAPQRVVAQPKPVAPAPGAAPARPQPAPGKPAPVPTPAQAAAAGAAPAVTSAKPAAATPAAQSKQTAGQPPAEKAAEVPVPATAATGAKGGAVTPAEAAPGKPADGTGAEPGEAAKPREAATAPTAPPAIPAAGARPRPPSRPVAPLPSETAILPPYSRGRDPWYQRVLASPRYLVLAISGVLIVGGGAAYGLTQLAEEEAPPPSEERTGGFENGEQEGENRKKAPPINPASVTVSVLNGTTVPGLAAQISDKIESFGFQLGNITNNSDQQRAESVVLFAPGSEREAAAVGRRLRIGQREPIDPQSQALGGDAAVVVIAGADQTQ